MKGAQSRSKAAQTPKPSGSCPPQAGGLTLWPCQSLAADKRKPFHSPLSPCKYTPAHTYTAGVPGSQKLCSVAVMLTCSPVLYSIFSPPDNSKVQKKEPALCWYMYKRDGAHQDLPAFCQQQGENGGSVSRVSRNPFGFISHHFATFLH